MFSLHTIHNSRKWPKPSFLIIFDKNDNFIKMLLYSRNDIYKIADLSFLIILIILIIFCDFLKIFGDFLVILWVFIDQREKIYYLSLYVAVIFLLIELYPFVILTAKSWDINPWREPQSSEHWPAKIPVRSDRTTSREMRPGTASERRRSGGTATECKTSVAVSKSSIGARGASNEQTAERDQQAPAGRFVDILMSTEQVAQYHWAPVQSTQ